MVDWNGVDAAGGAIFNASGTLTVQDSVLSHNAADNAVGGAVVNGDKATCTDGELSDNFAGRDGGAVQNEGVLAVVGGLVVDDRAVLGGGGIDDEGSATLTRVKVKADSAGGVGGGIRDRKESGPTALTLHHGTVADDTAAVDGGGVFNDAGAGVALDDSRVVNDRPDDCVPLNTVPGCAD
ncbi:hypothetical protein ACH4E7_23370 [Kitasatospora sp. NPDC018058]|uniref:hypothetical protein n=1 Tax=Kitasatospora sp. NPDC018058 TaxID=3364025 RepID=UPI0037C04F9A